MNSSLLDAIGCGGLLIIVSLLQWFIELVHVDVWLGEAKIYEFMLVYKNKRY